ncbi:hypothetical protein AVEN_63512-1 [Araneus ventricosus]|uniref:Uncharacterized protein n=1 Tax=Araneus ventricosus TaxID=182803 RepID=A0A4Y2KYM2_ARAVE|nr:hypothetical protein AVEN_63512-1 [Araneus ventricosus]
MVSFDDVWRPIACPWLSPYHCPSGIVLDVKSRLIRKEYVASLLWCPTAMFTNPMQRRSDVRWGQRHTKQQVVVRTVLLQAVCATLFGGIWAFLQHQRAATPAVALLVPTGVWHIATGSDRLPLW